MNGVEEATLMETITIQNTHAHIANIRIREINQTTLGFIIKKVLHLHDHHTHRSTAIINNHPNKRKDHPIKRRSIYA